MADEEDLISQILNEDSSTKVDYNPNTQDINSILNSTEETKVEVSEEK